MFDLNIPAPILYSTRTPWATKYGKDSWQRVINDFPAVRQNAVTYPLSQRLYLAQLRSEHINPPISLNLFHIPRKWL
ncbi:hypothetical protein D0A34_19675 [Microcoleus vaginatus PCC 9802]|uniref:hypothetical protein n=1 Tax=Microcoleus vaginatus TaxID=119532 RepID=UPI00020D1AAB|nr:hypothetical protein MicvaDRAFT_5160 [Microcoleus vaginatus FGP-2]UNU20798.1 hypothetical protein D0A34_19675 [Microcoleus vaginatus PCC 9802]